MVYIENLQLYFSVTLNLAPSRLDISNPAPAGFGEIKSGATPPLCTTLKTRSEAMRLSQDQGIQS